MTAYALAYMRTIDLNDEVREYLARIDDTLTPYQGAFLVHGSQPQVVDGDLPGIVVIIGFPDTEHAVAWYESPDYQAILALRTENSEGGAAILDGVPVGYRADSLLAKIDG